MKTLCVLVASLLLLALAVGCEEPTPKKGGGTKQQQPQQKQTQQKKSKLPPTRDEMRAKLMGKSKAEVLKLIGRPDRTTDAGWQYEGGISYDPIAQRVDSLVFIWFDEAGNVGQIDF